MDQEKKSVRIEENISCTGYYDVIVVGGGVAGCAAALAAGRRGKRVLLIEKGVLLGGLATIGLINLFVPMCNGRGTHIIRGMAEELLRLSVKYGYDTIAEEWRKGEPAQPTQHRYMTRFSPQIFALTLTDLLCSEGIDIRFDSLMSLPVMNGTHCDGLVVESKSGREFFAAGMIVDASGDADVIFRAGVPTVQGKNYFIYTGHAVTLESCRAAADSGNIGKALVRCYGGNADLYGRKQPEDIPLFGGTDAPGISRFLILNQRLLLDKIRDEDRLSREIVTLPTMAQFRTTRRIDGDYTLLESDAYRHFDDSVGAICDFDRRDFLYEIPFRSMVRSGYDNLITAGRCVAGEGYAWDVLRVIPPAIISGQAAGCAAAQALDTSRPIHDVDIPTLQRQLELDDVMIHFQDALIPDAHVTDVDSESEHF